MREVIFYTRFLEQPYPDRGALCYNKTYPIIIPARRAAGKKGREYVPEKSTLHHRPDRPECCRIYLPQFRRDDGGCILYAAKRRHVCAAPKGGRVLPAVYVHLPPLRVLPPGQQHADAGSDGLAAGACPGKAEVPAPLLCGRALRQPPLGVRGDKDRGVRGERRGVRRHFRDHRGASVHCASQPRADRHGLRAGDPAHDCPHIVLRVHQLRR